MLLKQWVGTVKQQQLGDLIQLIQKQLGGLMQLKERQLGDLISQNKVNSVTWYN